MITDLDRIVGDFATALKAVDSTGPQDRMKRYRPGVGPLTEADAVKEALNYLKHSNPETYASAAPRPYPGTQQKCDLVIPWAWAIEFKLIRPFGDNGKEAEHWSENILHPYKGNTSSIGDCLKLRDSAFRERKAIIVLGFEHTPPVIDLEVAIKSFEVIAVQVVGINLSARYSAEFTDLIHPYHQQGKVLGWEILQERI